MYLAERLQENQGWGGGGGVRFKALMKIMFFFSYVFFFVYIVT